MSADRSRPDGDRDDAATGRSHRDARRRCSTELHALDPDSPACESSPRPAGRAHLPLVDYLARRFAGRGEPLDDLVQVGTIGLIKAIDRFDPERGLEFSTYATPDHRRRDQAALPRHGLDGPGAAPAAGAAGDAVHAARADLSPGARPSADGRRARRSGIDVDEEAGDRGARRGARLLRRPDRRASPPAGVTVADTRSWATIDDGLSTSSCASAARRCSPVCRSASARSWCCGSSRTRPRPRSPRCVGVSQMHVSRLVARGLKRLREQLARRRAAELPTGDRRLARLAVQRRPRRRGEQQHQHRERGHAGSGRRSHGRPAWNARL